MKITRTSSFSGKQRTKDLPITAQQWAEYESGELIQRAMPDLSAEDREFIITGNIQEEWDAMFPEEDEK